MAVNIGPRIGIDGEPEFRKQINNIIQEVKTLKSEYDKVTSSMEKGKTTLKGNAEQHKVLSQQIEAQKERVKELGRMVDESTKKYGEADTRTLKWKQALNEATTELNLMEQKLKELPSSLTLVGEKMDQVGQKIQSIGSGMKDLGRALTPISTAASAVIAGGVKTFMDFEHQMSRVKAISGATAEEFEQLNQKAKDMGATTKFTATEAAEAFEYMGMAGWKSEQMIEGIPAIMDLAAASGEELGSVSDIVTDALTAFGLSAKDAGRFTDVLASASTNANTNVAMMGQSFKYVAPLAGSMGYSIEDVAVALGLMANNGIKADMAGTTLRNILNRMAKPTKESANAMKALGLELYDVDGNMYSLNELMLQMREGFKGLMKPVDGFADSLNELYADLEAGNLTEKKYEDAVDELIRKTYGAEAAEKARTAAMLAGTRGLSGLLAIVNSSEEDFTQLTNAINNSTGAAHNMAETMIADTAGAVTKMKSALEGAGIELGEVFAPYIQKGAEAVQQMAVSFKNLSQEEQESIAKKAVLVAASAPMLKLFGGMAEGLGKLVSAGGQFTQWLGNLGAPAGPIAIAVAGLGAVVAGVYALQTAIDNARTDSLNKALSNALKNDDGVPIDQLFASVTDTITDLSATFDLVAQRSVALNNAKDNVTNLTMEIDKIKISMEAGVISTEEGAKQIEEKLGSLADAISAKMTAASEVLLAALGDGGALASSLERTGEGVDEVRKKVVTSVDNVQDKIAELEERMKTAQWGSDEWFEAYNELMQLGGGVDAVKESVEGFEGYINGNPIDWSKYFGQDGSFSFEDFRNDLQATTDAAATYSEDMKTSMDSVVDAVKQIGDFELTKTIKEAIPGAMEEGNNQIAAKALEAVNIIQTDMIGGVDDVMKQAEQDWKEMSPWKKLLVFNGDEKGYVLSQINKYKQDCLDPASQEIESMMEELGVDGAGWASDAMDEIIKSMFEIPSQAEYANGAKVKLKDNWEEILNSAGEAAATVAGERGKDVIDGFNSGVSENVGSSEEEVTNWMERLVDAIHDSAMQFGSPSETMREFGEGTVEGFNEGIIENEDTTVDEAQSWMDSVVSVIEDAVPEFLNGFEEMKEGSSSIMEEAQGLISSAMDRIKSVFDTEISFPKIKLPHFSIDGEFSLNPPRVPHISIDWYAKAMENGMRLTNATIFGAKNGRLLGGGEAGNEWIVGENSLMGMIRTAVESSVGNGGGNSVNIGETTINVYGAPGQDINELAIEIDRLIGARVNRIENAWA